MNSSSGAPSRRIKAKSTCIVKNACLLLTLALPLATPGFAQDPPLPEIRARTYPVSVNRISRSGRVYLFEDPNEARPFPGRILLLKREKQSVMAFRVLRTYEDKRQFAGKVVRKYPDFETLPAEELFTGIEKISDIAPPAPTQQDRNDLKELESGSGVIPPAAGSEGGVGGSPAAPGSKSEILPYDPELDTGTSPALSGAVDSEFEKDPPAVGEDEPEEGYEDEDEMVIEEVLPLDHFRQSLSLQFAMLLNRGQDGKPALYANRGGGLRYSLTLGKMIFLKRARTQDSLAAEGGFFAYLAQHFAGTGSSYTLLPLSGTLRYTINFDNRWGLFGYFGVMVNRVIADSNATAEGRALLTSTFPSFGAGLLMAVGPGWDLRTDLGVDMLAIGLMLRF